MKYFTSTFISISKSKSKSYYIYMLYIGVAMKENLDNGGFVKIMEGSNLFNG